ncbi:MAG: alternate F1F0 ATPase, F1 subunit alpha [Spirochaetia bacterium]
MNDVHSPFKDIPDSAFESVERSFNRRKGSPAVREYGVVTHVGEGIARVKGLPSAKFEEIIQFPEGKVGTVFNLDEDEIGVMLLNRNTGITAGSEVYGTGRVLDVPVGEGLLGRVVDPVGRPLDDKGDLEFSERRSYMREAPSIMDRDPVEEPLQTGIQAIDALIPVGRGQRELILGDRQTGKTAITVDTMINQRDTGVICIYCAVGQRSSAAAKVVSELKDFGVMDNCIVVSTTEEDPPGLVYAAPYSATSMGEYFMDQGKDVLLIYDDLTRHARSYRELSLLFRRPPAREAYPGDIFYIHSRLLERSTHRKEDLGGGSLTALPIIETQAQNISAYIPTNLISITDGQIYLSPDLFSKGVLPPIEVGQSVSRVGGKTQLPAYRIVAGDLKLSYSQFQELENFARFGVRLDEETQKTLDRGRRVREVLKQKQHQPIPVPEQIGILLAVTKGVFDDINTDGIQKAKEKIRKAVREKLGDLSKKIEAGEKFSEEEQERFIETARTAVHGEE